tara:strand:- start:77 stop:706 length:630 start_codon:yes stop_codon:yes gene_type:complete
MAKLIKNEARACPKRFTPKAESLLTKSVTAEGKGRIAAQACTDQMIADDLKWTDFISPAGKTGKSTSTPELHKALKDAILKGLGANAVKLTRLPVKSLSEADKATKDANNKLIGRKMGAQLKAIRLRTDDVYRASQSKAKTKAPQQPKTGDKVVDEANALSLKAIKKETDLQNWHVNNLGQITAIEIGKLRSKIIDLLKVPHTPVEPNH